MDTLVLKKATKKWFYQIIAVLRPTKHKQQNVYDDFYLRCVIILYHFSYLINIEKRSLIPCSMCGINYFFFLFHLFSSNQSFGNRNLILKSPARLRRWTRTSQMNALIWHHCGFNPFWELQSWWRAVSDSKQERFQLGVMKILLFKPVCLVKLVRNGWAVRIFWS